MKIGRRGFLWTAVVVLLYPFSRKGIEEDDLDGRTTSIDDHIQTFQETCFSNHIFPSVKITYGMG